MRLHQIRRNCSPFAMAVIFVTVISIPTAIDSAIAQDMNYEGYLADVLCAERGTALDGADMTKHPEKHSVACLKEPPCMASGFGILIKNKDAGYTFHKFDQKGNQLVKDLLAKTKKIDNMTVAVMGQIKDGIVGVSSISEK